MTAFHPVNRKPAPPIGGETFIKSGEGFSRRIPNHNCETQVKNADSETVPAKYKVHPDGIAFRSGKGGKAFMALQGQKTYALNESGKTALSMDAPGIQNRFAHPAACFMA